MAFALTAGLTLALAVFALTRRRLLWGVVGVGAHSLALAGVYFLLAAPDVALTEAAIGFALVTFVYLLALRRTGRLVVVATPAYPLLYPQGDGVAGLEWELLAHLARRIHRDLDVLWVPGAEVGRLLATGEADLAAGAFLPTSDEEGRLLLSRPLVPTRLVAARVGRGPLGAVRGDRAAAHLPRGGAGRGVPRGSAGRNASWHAGWGRG
ncbi:MAG: hydrogenase subunit MbhD domain-containing protein [Candidatus Bipolaricaulaceae bacterium]